MRKLFLYIFVLVAAASFVYSASTIPAGFVYEKNGIVTTPDSARINMMFQPSGLDTAFGVEPDSGIWDTVFSITDNADKYVSIFYTIFSGSDTAYGTEVLSLRLDTASFTDDYWAKLADRADSGSIANVGLLVWTYATRELTAISNVSLTAAERAAIADSARAEIERSDGFLWSLVYYWATCDGCYAVYYPDDGTSPKDSVAVFDDAGTKQSVIHYRNSNVSTVLDSSEVEAR